MMGKEKKTEIHPTECILEDDYPVHAGYIYLLDGEVTRSKVSGNVGSLKALTKTKEIRRCDLRARGLLS